MAEFLQFTITDAAFEAASRFVEEGCYGALGLLSSGISGQEVLNEWKKEALGYVRGSQKRYNSRK